MNISWGFLCSADDWKDDGGIDMQRSTGKTKTFSRLSDLQVLSLGTKKKNLKGKRRTYTRQNNNTTIESHAVDPGERLSKQ